MVDGERFYGSGVHGLECKMWGGGVERLWLRIWIESQSVRVNVRFRGQGSR